MNEENKKISRQALEKIEEARRKKGRQRKGKGSNIGRWGKLVTMKNLSEIFCDIKGERISPSEIREVFLALSSYPKDLLQDKAEEAEALSWYVGFLLEEMLSKSKFVKDILKAEIANAARLDFERDLRKIENEENKEEPEIPQDPKECAEAYMSIVRGVR